MIGIAIISLAAVCPANAHSWYTQKKDPVTNLGCCGGTDCATLLIEPGVISAEVNGYRVVLTVEQAQRINPARRDGVNILIPWERVKPSEDGNWHLCLPRWNDLTLGDFYCFFAPPNG
jgi:hypothetical protein